MDSSMPPGARAPRFIYFGGYLKLPLRMQLDVEVKVANISCCCAFEDSSLQIYLKSAQAYLHTIYPASRPNIA